MQSKRTSKDDSNFHTVFLRSSLSFDLSIPPPLHLLLNRNGQAFAAEGDFTASRIAVRDAIQGFLLVPIPDAALF